jgi:hypothetical protein
MHKSINGLSSLVEQELELNPMINTLFMFCNRNRDKVNTVLGAQWLCAVVQTVGKARF